MPFIMHPPLVDGYRVQPTGSTAIWITELPANVDKEHPFLMPRFVTQVDRCNAVTFVHCAAAAAVRGIGAQEFPRGCGLPLAYRRRVRQRTDDAVGGLQDLPRCTTTLANPDHLKATMPLIRPTLIAISLASALGLGACGMFPMASTPTSTALTARLAGSSEVPAVKTDATGMVEATLARDSNVLSWRVTYSGLSGPATGAHFHGPAMAGQNAGVVVPITGPLSSPLVGSATLTPGQAADLTAGKWYVNLHTAAHPNGEARGQVSVRP